MQSTSGNQLVKNFFTNGRHLNLSVVFVSQNLFYTGKKFRTISFNSTYIVVFKNPRDQSQIRHLACQMFPSKPKFLQLAYEDATKDPYRYLFLDFHPNSPGFARVRRNIFPCDLLDDPCCLYLPKDMQISRKFAIPSLCIKEPAYLTKCSFALGLDYVKTYNSYHGQCKI